MLMSNTVSYTSTLPEDVMKQLNEYAEKLGLPKNKLIERSLRLYLDKLKQMEYVRSFQRAGMDKDLVEMAEESLQDYLNTLDNL